LRVTEAQYPLKGRKGALFIVTSTTSELQSKEAQMNNCFTATEKNKTLTIKHMKLSLNLTTSNNCRKIALHSNSKSMSQQVFNIASV
jgi:hypothetical protein